MVSFLRVDVGRCVEPLYILCTLVIVGGLHAYFLIYIIKHHTIELISL